MVSGTSSVDDAIRRRCAFSRLLLIMRPAFDDSSPEAMTAAIGTIFTVARMHVYIQDARYFLTPIFTDSDRGSLGGLITSLPLVSSIFMFSYLSMMEYVRIYFPYYTTSLSSASSTHSGSHHSERGTKRECVFRRYLSVVTNLPQRPKVSVSLEFRNQGYTINGHLNPQAAVTAATI